METEEILEVFDADGTPLGYATRHDVHRKGLWHQTFQIWFVEINEGVPWVWFQRRSPEKAQYRDLWDITVAGHLMVGEGPRDGFREIREELGIDIHPDSAYYFGVVPDEILGREGADRELCHVFFATAPCEITQLEWASSEVADVGRVRLNEAAALVQGLRDSMTVITRDITQVVDAGMLVPHSKDYYKTVFSALVEHFRSREVRHQ